MRVRFLFAVVVAVVFSCSALAKKPNFVFILVDDLGYMDIGANNPKTFYETPNVDRLASEGMRFTNGYAANPVCSPTRYSIMTGKYPSRVDATNFFSGMRAGKFLPAPLNDRMPLSEITVAEALKTAGYRTAFVGKWHLGPTPEFWPEAQGFDINIAGHHRGSPPGGYFAPFRNPKLKDGPKGEFLTKRLTDESIKILEQFKDQPFLLYLAFYTVHIPLQAPKELVAKYEKKAKKLAPSEEFATEEQILPIKQPRRIRIRQNHPVYAAMVESMDTQVGRLLQKLEELKLEDHTVVCFMSDNGGLCSAEGHPTSNLPLRGGKGWLYEGGIREPFLIKWPGVTKPGSVCHVPVMSIDFYPTILEIAGVKAKHTIDGVSLVPLLRQTGNIDNRALYWHYPHYSNQGGFPGGAIRVGDFKLIERYEDGRVHLYNLKNDIGESTDLAGRMPEQVKTMRQRLHAWYKQVDAKFLRAKEGGPKPWSDMLNER
ncbi:MAG: sulfatase [Gemmatales bacterium]|nr:MAG: sulfatase [Gemmatales bacterium]